MIKVLHVYKTALPFSRGGVEVFLDSLCHTTADFGVENVILTLSKKGHGQLIQMPKYRVISAKENIVLASTGFSFSAFLLFREWVANVDIIHYHFPNPFADLLHFSCQIKIKTILTYHADIVRQKHILKLYRPLMTRFLGSMDKIIATSPNYLKSSQHLKKFEKKIEIIPIGIGKNRYPLASEERLNYWKRRLPGLFFLFVGALRYYKGLRGCLAAIKGTDIFLVIAGVGEEEEELKRYAQKHAINNVDFVGPVSDEDKVVLITCCYSCVFPSFLRSEAFGVFLLEGAAYGKPLISCEIGTGTSFVNIHMETGLVVKPALPAGLRAAMLYLIQRPSEAKRLGLNAYKRYKQYFSANQQAQHYVSIYKKLLNQRP